MCTTYLITSMITPASLPSFYRLQAQMPQRCSSSLVTRTTLGTSFTDLRRRTSTSSGHRAASWPLWVENPGGATRLRNTSLASTTSRPRGSAPCVRCACCSAADEGEGLSSTLPWTCCMPSSSIWRGQGAIRTWSPLLGELAAFSGSCPSSGASHATSSRPLHAPSHSPSRPALSPALLLRAASYGQNSTMSWPPRALGIRACSK